MDSGTVVPYSQKKHMPKLDSTRQATYNKTEMPEIDPVIFDKPKCGNQCREQVGFLYIKVRCRKVGERRFSGD